MWLRVMTSLLFYSKSSCGPFLFFLTTIRTSRPNNLSFERSVLSKFYLFFKMMTIFQTPSISYRMHKCLNELIYNSTLPNVWDENSIFLNALNPDHLAVPSTQGLSELITQVVVDLEGEYNCCVWRTTCT